MVRVSIKGKGIDIGFRVKGLGFRGKKPFSGNF
jgi:hypothetical protein